jgi:hypothetical protein
MEFDIKVQNLAMIYYYIGRSLSQKRYPLRTKKLLENFSTDVCYLFTNNKVFIYHCSCKSLSFFVVNAKIGIIQKLIILF